MTNTKKSKNYISGGARRRDFDNGGYVINLDLKLEDLNNLKVSDKGYIRLVVAERQSVDDYGNTHYVYENDFVPEKKTEAAPSDKGGIDKGLGKSKSPSVGFNSAKRGGGAPF